MQKRNLFTTLILPIVTLGIFYVYWLHTVGQDAAKMAKRQAPNIMLLITPLLVGLLFLVVAIATADFDSLGDAVEKSIDLDDESIFEAAIEDEAEGNVGLALLPIALIVGFVTISIYFWKWAKTFSAATKGKVSFGVALLMLFAQPYPLGLAYFQDHINNHMTK